MADSLQSLSRHVVPAATLAAAIVVWELASRILRIPKFVVPASSQIAAEAWEWRYRVHRALVGDPVRNARRLRALDRGRGAARDADRLLAVAAPRALSLIVLLQAVPKIAMAPVLLLVIGYGETSKMIVAF